MGLFDGKTALIFGVANKRSIAWGIADGGQILRKPATLAGNTRMSIMGLLPLLTGRNVVASEDRRFAESVLTLRSRLLDALAGKSAACVLVTSAAPGTGKTTLAMVLARSLAGAGKNVLLLDCDLRTAGLSRQLAMEDQPGLADILTGRSDFERAVVQMPTPGLWVMPAGQVESANDCADLLAQATMQACMQEWSAMHDIIIVDSPAVLPAADARILSTYVDLPLLVVRSGLSRHSDVLETLDHLTAPSGGRFPIAFVARPGK